ncbi:MAG: SH3 domain-containing protein [Agathobacter sp.]|nr:SH3 domain-containing protein [Agathobacter sp.]
MINNNLRITAGFLAGILLFSSTPAEWLAVEDANTSETVTYMSDELYYFSAGAVSAMNETVVLDKDDDDTILADKETGVTENDAPVVSEPEEGGETPVTPEETPDIPEEKPEEVVPVNPFANIAIANKINNYTYVRKAPNADGEVLGKMYKNNAAVVLEDLGDWYKVTSGNVTGYVAAKFVTVGDAAVCKKVATITAKSTTNGLRLRKKASTSAGIYTILGKGAKVTVLDDSIEGWLKVKYKSYTGYISADYADVTITYEYGETKAEEKARLKKEEEAKKKAEEEKKKQEQAEKDKYKDPTGKDGQAVIDYALQFVGNKYVWGGESLTKGVDCSGFVMKVYEKFGIKLPHSSYKLRKVGKAVKASDLQPGDIICYSGHVALYIGNGKIVHAANKKDGIKISNNYKYKKVLAIRRVL